MKQLSANENDMTKKLHEMIREAYFDLLVLFNPVDLCNAFFGGVNGLFGD